MIEPHLAPASAADLSDGSDSLAALEGMEAMVAEVRSGPAIYQPSAFWEELCATNVAMIRAHGLEHFKLSLAQNYFNWMVVSPRNAQFRRAFKLWLTRPRLLPWQTAMGDVAGLWTTLGEEAIPFTWRRRTTYRWYVGLLWDYMLRVDHTGLGREMEEPTVGDPIPLTRAGRRISQDLANSIIEYNTVIRANGGKAPAVVAELGAGYGRLAHVFLSRPETQRYCIVDIPPALMVSQWYLSRILPGRRIFTFRHFDDFASVRDEYEASELAFLTPNQLEMLPERHFNVMLSISTFPEMRTEQISHYLKLFASLTADHIFIKQWKNWRNPKDDTYVTVDDYQLPPEWRRSIEENDPTMPAFFNLAWSRTC